MGHLCPHGPVNLKLTLAPTSQPPISLACSVCARACVGAGATPTLTATLNRYNKFWALRLWSHDNGFEHGINYNVHNLFYGSKNTRPLRWLRNVFCSNKLRYRSIPEMDQRRFLERYTVLFTFEICNLLWKTYDIYTHLTAFKIFFANVKLFQEQLLKHNSACLSGSRPLQWTCFTPFAFLQLKALLGTRHPGPRPRNTSAAPVLKAGGEG